MGNKGFITRVSRGYDKQAVFTKSSNKMSKAKYLKNQKIEESAEIAFSYSLEDKETVKNMNLINPYIFHELLYILSERDTNLAISILNENHSRIKAFLNLDVSEYKSKFQKEKLYDVADLLGKKIEELLKGCKDRLSYAWQFLVYFIMSFYDNSNGDGIEQNIERILSEDVMTFVFAMELEHRIFEKSIENDSEYSDLTELMNSSWQAKRQGYKLLSPVLTSPIWNQETKEEFAVLYNNYISKFISTDVSVFADRGTVESIFENVDKKIAEKWLPLITLAKQGRSLSDVTELNQHSTFSMKILEKYGFEGYAIFSKLNGMFDTYVNRLFEAMREKCFLQLFSDYYKGVIEDKDTLYSTSQDEIKSLKVSNRSLMKDIKQYESNLDTLSKEKGRLEDEITELHKSVCNNEEFVKLQAELDKIKAEKQILEDNEKKLVQKSDWKDNRISELTEELEKYSELESDLMQLQNENTAILAQIDRIEALEEDTEEISFDEKLEKIKDEPILFVGGTGGMLLKLSKMFPNSDCIDISDVGSNFDVGQRFSYIVIYTKVVTHSHYNRVESQVDKNKIIPINICNSNLVIDELYKKIIGHKN